MLAILVYCTAISKRIAASPAAKCETDKSLKLKSERGTPVVDACALWRGYMWNKIISKLF